MIKPKFYLALFHGRPSPNTELDDWGLDGPIFPCLSLNSTYAADLRMTSHPGGDIETLLYVADLVYYNGVYFGDYEIIMPEDLTDEMKARIVYYEIIKANPPVAKTPSTIGDPPEGHIWIRARVQRASVSHSDVVVAVKRGAQYHEMCDTAITEARRLSMDMTEDTYRVSGWRPVEWADLKATDLGDSYDNQMGALAWRLKNAIAKGSAHSEFQLLSRYFDLIVAARRELEKHPL